MRHLFFLLAVLLPGISHLHAQQDSGTFRSSAAVKWNYPGLYFGKISLLGEYNFKHRKSVTFAIGIPVKHKTTIEINDEYREVEMKSFSLMGGYRMYLGKKTMSGLYFEPYLKYLKNDASTIIDGDLNGRSVNFATTSAYSAVGAGAQLGVQFTIARRVLLDFFFLGPEANIASHEAIMRDVNSVLPWTQVEADDAEQEIEDNIGDIPIIGNKIEVKVDAAQKTVSSKYNGFLPGFRFGLSVGVRL